MADEIQIINSNIKNIANSISIDGHSEVQVPNIKGKEEEIILESENRNLDESIDTLYVDEKTAEEVTEKIRTDAYMAPLSTQTFGDNRAPLSTARILLQVILGNETLIERGDVEASTKVQLDFSKWLKGKFCKFIDKLSRKKDTLGKEKDFITTMNQEINPYRYFFLDDKQKFDEGKVKNFRQCLLDIDEKGVCYICNKKITKSHSSMEIEHILPFAVGSKFSAVIKKLETSLIKKLGSINSKGQLIYNIKNTSSGEPGTASKKYVVANADGVDKEHTITVTGGDIYMNSFEVLLSLLEIRESHRCCNQIKCASVFVERENKNGKYILKEKVLQDFINAIQKNKKYDCKSIFKTSEKIDNTNLKKYFKLIAHLINKSELNMFNQWKKVRSGSLNKKLGSNEWNRFLEYVKMVRISNFAAMIPPAVFETTEMSKAITYVSPYIVEKVVKDKLNKQYLVIKTKGKKGIDKSLETLSNILNELLFSDGIGEKLNTLIEHINENRGEGDKAIGTSRPSRNPVQDVEKMIRLCDKYFFNNELMNLSISVYAKIYGSNKLHQEQELERLEIEYPEDVISNIAAILFIHNCYTKKPLEEIFMDDLKVASFVPKKRELSFNFEREEYNYERVIELYNIMKDEDIAVQNLLNITPEMLIQKDNARDREVTSDDIEEVNKELDVWFSSDDYEYSEYFPVGTVLDFSQYDDDELLIGQVMSIEQDKDNETIVYHKIELDNGKTFWMNAQGNMFKKTTMFGFVSDDNKYTLFDEGEYEGGSRNRKKSIKKRKTKKLKRKNSHKKSKKIIT